LGFNYRMTDLQAAVGRVQLTRLDGVLEKRRHLAREYMTGLQDVADIALPLEPIWARTNWQSFCIGLSARCDQKRVMQALLDRGISTRRGVMNAHIERPYREQSGAPLPRSEQAQQGLILPLTAEMKSGNVAFVCDSLRSAIAEATS